MGADFSEVGTRIKRFRKQQKISQSELAEWIDCNQSHLSYVENGSKSVSLDMLVRIANALRVSADELLADYIDKTIQVDSKEFELLFQDCSDWERKTLLEMLKVTKNILKTYVPRNASDR